MKKIYRVSAAIVAGLSLLGVTNPASSLGFGRPTSRAVLGEALSVSVPIRLEAGEEIANDCVAADVYFGDDKLSESAVATTLVPGGQTERTVRVSTTALVNEPVVTVFMAVGCKAKITRKFVAFADPPGMVTLPAQVVNETAPALLTPGTPVAPRARSSSSGLQGNADSGSAAPRPARKTASTSATPRSASAKPSNARPPGGGTGSNAAVAGTGQRAQPKAMAGTGGLSARMDSQAKAPVKETSRLELDPAEQDAMIAPELMMTSALGSLGGDLDAPAVRERRAAAAALWAAMNASPEQLAQDRVRMQELEQRLARLQQDSAGARDKVAAMEARVRAAEDQRLNHPVVWGLAGLCLILLAGLAWLFTRRRRQSEAQASWWQGETPDDAPDTAPAMGEPPLARTSAEFMPRGAEPVVPSVAAEPASAQASGQPAAAATPPAVDPDTIRTRPVSLKSEAQEAVREITVEELIDLEQQAEFFVVLGQDDAALELLESHVQTTAGASPLPYLKLLEIYQRLNKREDYERVRSTFNSRFNAYAPSWESDLQHGHALEEYPGVVDRLQSLWSHPAKAMELLQVSLTRADGSEETFDLPAYRELLFLYAVARDLSERESQDRAPVDLLLPVQDAEGDVDDRRDKTLQPLMATRPVKALPEASPSLSLDLSLDDPVPSGSGGFVDDGYVQVTPPAPSDAGQASPKDGHSIDFDPMDLPDLPPRR